MCFCRTRVPKHIVRSSIPRVSTDPLGNSRRSPVFLSPRPATKENVRISNFYFSPGACFRLSVTTPVGRGGTRMRVIEYKGDLYNENCPHRYLYRPRTIDWRGCFGTAQRRDDPYPQHLEVAHERTAEPGTPRSQKRDLGHPLKVRPEHFIS